MSKNTKLIVLGFLVAGIWSSIGYKLYVYIMEDEDVPVLIKKPLAVDTTQVQSYVLSLSYPDPFLKKKVESMTKAVTKLSSKNPIKLQPVRQNHEHVVVNWTLVKYMGTFYNAAKKRKTATLSIAGNEYFASEGEKIDGFKVVTIFQDSIRLEFGNLFHVVKK